MEDHPTIYADDKEGTRIGFRLWHVLPKGSSKYVTQYIKDFAEEAEWKVKKVKHQKFMIWITV